MAVLPIRKFLGLTKTDQIRLQMAAIPLLEHERVQQDKVGSHPQCS